MGIDVNHIPGVIQGTVPQPGRYGASAHSQYMDYLYATESHFNRTGDIEPLEKLNQASVRYTPSDTIKTGAVTEEAIQNALGYAQADIQTFDWDRDQALNRQEVLTAFLAPSISQLKALQRTISDPRRAQADRVNAFQHRNLILWFTASKAANYMASVDTPNPHTGQRDGVITADEAAAKLLFDDSAKQMFTDNQQAYKTILDGLKSKTRYDGPSFEQLQQQVGEAVNRNPASAFQLDGQATVGERDIADILTAAPIPTNQVVSQIHDTLHLKQRLAPRSPFCY